MNTTNNTLSTAAPWQVLAPYNAAYESILSSEAMDFIVALHHQFETRRQAILIQRAEKQKAIDNGLLPSFDESTAHIRHADWKVADIPADLQDRRVEITGPVDRKMMINALNSGAKVFMADLEDSNSPNWDNNLQGQINLYDAVRKTIQYTQAETGKTYTLNSETAVLMVRPRGWHLIEKQMLINGTPVSGSLFDFGLYFFHNAAELLARGTAPYFYLPKIEHYTEAALWNDVFVFAQNYVGVPQSTIKATVLIETILASFQLNEILWELKEHIVGLNCGRWDYIFSFIKKFRNVPGYIFPDRSQITMTVPCMRAYTQLVVQTCHRRGALAMGGMAAQIPIKNDAEKNAIALEKVQNDKLREVQDGHDGTWVAHPALVPVAMQIFDTYMPTPNQLSVLRADFKTDVDELLALPQGSITEAGLRNNINVGILYIESWLRGNGAAAIHHLMEDAATAEISRTQVWQWLQHKVSLADGQVVDIDLINKLIQEELLHIQAYVGQEAYANGRFAEAVKLFNSLIQQSQFEEFLTSKAYDLI